jgi:hypothetical protein
MSSSSHSIRSVLIGIEYRNRGQTLNVERLMHVKLNHTYYISCHCDSIIDFLANSYFIVQIYHAKSFKMKYIRSVYLDIHKDT